MKQHFIPWSLGMDFQQNRSPFARYFISINRGMERLMPIVTPFGVLMGFLFFRQFIQLRPFIPWLFGLMTFSGALKLRVSEIGHALKNPLPLALFLLMSHVAMPLLALGVGTLLNPHNPDLSAGFVLLFSIPTAVSGFIWISIFKGDGALSLAIILLDTLAAPFLVPATVSLLLRRGIHIDMTGMALSLIWMIVLPTILGIGVNEASNGSVPRVVSPYLSVAAKLALFLVVAANSAAIAPQVNFASLHTWGIAAQAVSLGVMGFILGRLGGAIIGTKRTQTVTLVFSSGLRNISAAATIAIAFFPKEAALPSILGMVFQQILASFAGRFLIGSQRAEKL